MAERSIGVPITFVLQMVNTEHFRPNMLINVSTDTAESNKLYKGIYNIKSADFAYSALPEPGKPFNTFATAAITLCNKIEGYDKDYAPKEV
jgi:hypothetical protein